MLSPKERREALLRWACWTPVVLLLLWAIVHAIRVRPFTRDDLLALCIVIGGLGILMTCVPLWIAAKQAGGWRKLRKEPGTFVTIAIIWLAMAIVGTGLWVIFELLPVSAYHAYLWILSPSLSTAEAALAAGTLTVILGGGLFWFRLHLRSIYGLSEAIIGIVVATQRVTIESSTAAKDPAFYLAMLTAGVYLVVRGLDNIHQGLTKEPRDTVALRLLARLGLLMEDEPERPADSDH